MDPPPIHPPKQPKKKIRCKSIADPLDTAPWGGEHNRNLRRFETLLMDVNEDNEAHFSLAPAKAKAVRSLSHKDPRSLLHPDRRRESGSQIHFYNPHGVPRLVRHRGVRNFSKVYPELAEFRVQLSEPQLASPRKKEAPEEDRQGPASSSVSMPPSVADPPPPIRLSLRSLLSNRSPTFRRFSDRPRTEPVSLGEECFGARLLCDNPRSSDEKDEYVEDFQPEIVENAFGWEVEAPGRDDFAMESPWEVDFLQFESDYYIAEFYQKEHYNFFATERILGHTIGSIRKDKVAQVVRVLIRTKKMAVKFEVPLSQARKVSMKVLFRDLAWNEGRAPAWSLQNIRAVQHPDLQDELVRYERADIFKKYKFGVLLVRQGQTRDDEFFSNVEGGAEYEEFLSVLGDRIELNGWKQYAGGLDVATHSTGEHSIYRLFYSLESRYEIMFHVSTLLPYQPSDTQHVRLLFFPHDTPFVLNLACS